METAGDRAGDLGAAVVVDDFVILTVDMKLLSLFDLDNDSCRWPVEVDGVVG
jgi:hypothetical protein